MKILYRYEIEYQNEDDQTRVSLREFEVIRETEKTYFIKDPSYHPYFLDKKIEKKIRKDAMNTYAYDTKEKAKDHFIRRTYTRIRWFHYWIQECEKGLELIEDYK